MSFNQKFSPTIVGLLFFILTSPGLVWAQIEDFILFENPVLEKAKEKISRDNPENNSELKLLLLGSEEALKSGPYSVVHKKQLPPSDDIHDYTSMGPYWWPDPEKEDGLPYIRRDGEINPEYYDYKDKEELGKLMNALQYLSQAFYFTGNEKYARKAIDLIRVWFLAPETKMNPNLNFAQRIPGRTEGRGIGIIDTRSLARLPDILMMLSASEHWNKTIETGMKDWLAKYVSWLINSEHGKDEAVHGNNHTTWYFAQIIPLALYLDQENRADSLAKAGLPLIFDEMIEKDGAQPKELSRTRSWDYSSMNLFGIMTYARACEKIGIDLWYRENEKGGSIKKALEFLYSYMVTKKEWPYEQIKERDLASLKTSLNIAAYKYQHKPYKKAADQLAAKTSSFNYWDLVNYQKMRR